MNYPAIISLLARVYNYAGKHDEAFGCVNEIMNLMSNPESRMNILSLESANEIDYEKLT